MKTQIISSLRIFLLLISFNNPSYSQGFNAVSIINNETVIAAGKNGTIYISTNTGTNWNAYTAPMVNFNSISTTGFNVYLTASDNKVYSTYADHSSPVAEITIGSGLIFNSICFINDNAGFICGDNGAIFKTTNAGINWSIQNSGIPAVSLKSISFNDMQNGVVCGDGGSIYITTNGGSSWVISAPVPMITNNLLKVKYFNDGITIAGEKGTLIVKPNGSSQWQAINTGVASDIRGITGSGINDIHICGGGGFIRNNKNGSSNFLNFESNPMMANLFDIFYYNNNLGFAVSSLNKAIIKTTNGGAVWTLLPGSAATFTWDPKLNAEGGFGNPLCMHPYDINTIFCGMTNKIYVSRNNGDNWTLLDSLPNGESIRSFYVSPLDTNIWLAAASGKIKKSTDYGRTWTVSIEMTFSIFGQPLEMDQNNPSVFYFAPDGGGFYKSTDIGSTFNLISNFPFQSPCDIIVKWDSPETILVGDGPTSGSGAKVYKSINGGVNWNLVLDSVGGFGEIPSMCNTVFNNNIVYVMVYGPSVYKSTNFGDTFSITHVSGNNNWASAICLEDPGYVIGGSFSFNGPSFITYNGGANWSNFQQGGNSFESGLISPNKSYALSYAGDGLFKLNVSYSEVTSIFENNVSVILPVDCILYQNYPNPFNPVTVVRYSLIENHFTTLKIFDALGKELITLVNQKQSPGNYEIEFDGSDLSSGVYFYKLESGNFIQTKRMILLK